MQPAPSPGETTQMDKPSPALDVVHTAYGSFSAHAFGIARAQADLPALMRFILELDQAAECLRPDAELRDALARLYCVSATMFCGAVVTVSPSEQSLRELVQDVRAGLNDLHGVIEGCSRAIESLERLVANGSAATSVC